MEREVSEFFNSCGWSICDGDLLKRDDGVKFKVHYDARYDDFFAHEYEDNIIQAHGIHLAFLNTEDLVPIWED